MLIDANILLFAVDEESRFHQTAAAWLTARLNGPERVGVPWPVLGAFLRITTHPRASAHPLTPDEAWDHVAGWLACEQVWVPRETDRHAEILAHLVREHDLRGNLIGDGQLAALALEHGLTICSADSDFARFPEVRWENPLRVR